MRTDTDHVTVLRIKDVDDERKIRKKKRFIEDLSVLRALGAGRLLRHQFPSSLRERQNAQTSDIQQGLRNTQAPGTHQSSKRQGMGQNEMMATEDMGERQAQTDGIKPRRASRTMMVLQ